MNITKFFTFCQNGFLLLEGVISCLSLIILSYILINCYHQASRSIVAITGKLKVLSYARCLAELIRKSPSDSVSKEFRDQNLVITCSSFKQDKGSDFVWILLHVKDEASSIFCGSNIEIFLVFGSEVCT